MLIKRRTAPSPLPEYALGQIMLHRTLGVVQIDCKAYFMGTGPMYFFTATDGKKSCGNRTCLSPYVPTTVRVLRRVRR